MFAKKTSKYTYGMQISDTEAKLVEIMNVNGQVTLTQRHSIALNKGSIKHGKFVDEDSVIARISTLVKQIGLQGAHMQCDGTAIQCGASQIGLFVIKR